MSQSKSRANNCVPMKWEAPADLSESFRHLKVLEKSQICINNYSVNHNKEFINNRNQIVEWLLFVSKNLNLRNETAFKAVHLLDIYISKTKKVISTIEELQYISVICLNLACKVEEVNCNYLNFLRENLLDEECSKGDFIKKETEVLKTLNFKLSMPNFYNFNNLFLEIVINSIKEANLSPKLIKTIIMINDMVIKNFVALKECVFSSPLNSGLISFKTTMLAFNYFVGSENEELNSSVDEKLLSTFCDEYLKRSNVVSYNLFTYFVNNKKFNFSKKPESG